MKKVPISLRNKMISLRGKFGNMGQYNLGLEFSKEGVVFSSFEWYFNCDVVDAIKNCVYKEWNEEDI